jgi:hypothetical protein
MVSAPLLLALLVLVLAPHDGLSAHQGRGNCRDPEPAVDERLTLTRPGG